MALQVIDSASNVIKAYPKSGPLKIDNEKGFHAGQIQLSKEPNLGRWSIIVQDVEGKGERETLSFDVDQYVLPKYKLELATMPSFVTYNDSKAVITLTASYTHGEPVGANCRLTITVSFVKQIFPLK